MGLDSWRRQSRPLVIPHILHAADVAVWVWSIDDAAALSSSLAQGVDGVIGGDVATLVAGVEARAL